ncbi:MAG: DUF695 domain-containing protein [Pyrinomonadaceae bacterium]
MARERLKRNMDFDSITSALAEGEHEGHPLLIRFREFPDNFPRGSYPDRLNLFWQMLEVDENGWHNELEFERLRAFEDRLVEAVERDGQSILSVVLTCNNEKEFVFHTADEAIFLGRLTNMPQEQERYPLTILRNTDPEWNYFDSVIPGQT